jgi:RHS repeat-associated protein
MSKRFQLIQCCITTILLWLATIGNSSFAQCDEGPPYISPILACNGTITGVKVGWGVHQHADGTPVNYTWIKNGYPVENNSVIIYEQSYIEIIGNFTVGPGDVINFGATWGRSPYMCENQSAYQPYTVPYDQQPPYFIDGWGQACNGITTWQFDVPPNSEITLYAKHPGSENQLIVGYGHTGHVFTSAYAPEATYTLKVSVNGCELPTKTIGVGNITPQLGVSPSSPAVCPGEKIKLTGSSVIGYTTFAWRNASGVVLATGPTIDAPAGDVYFYGTSSEGCTASRKVTVVAKQKPPVPIVKEPIVSVCAPSTVTLSIAQDNNYDTYIWRDAQGSVIANQSGPSYTTTINGSTAFKVSGILTGNGCESDQATIQVNTNNPYYGCGTYVATTEILEAGITDQNLIVDLDYTKAARDIVYYDGLGRPKQQVSRQASPMAKDIVQPFVYDQYGREHRKYIPFGTNQTDGKAKNITYTWYGDYTHDFYHANEEDGSTVANERIPFSAITYEASPLNRIVKETRVGGEWHHFDKSVRYQYLTNINENGEEKIIAWKIDDNGMPVRNVSSFTPSGYYKTGALSVSSKKDEEDQEVREYTDKAGRIVLRKVQAEKTATDLNSNSQWAETYHVYDDFGRLRFTFQPLLSAKVTGNNSYNPSLDDLNNLAFQYKHDARGQIIEKKVPGADPVLMVYDKYDRLVMTQDGNQRKDNNGADKKEWLFTKYDEFNRPVITGIYIHTAVVSQESMTSLVNLAPNNYEVYNGNISTFGYTNNVWPTDNIKILNISYYDDYTFINDLAGNNYKYVSNDLEDQEPLENQRVIGQVTGTRTNILGTNIYLWNVVYYDAKYRPIQTITQYENAVNRVTNVYDLVRLKETKTVHSKGTTHTIYRKFSHDHRGRLLETKHKIDNENFIILNSNQYNELGQLVTKKLHSVNNGATYKQFVDYRYDSRGWLTRINNSRLTPDRINEPKDYFGINYNYGTIWMDVVDNIYDAESRYDGNIVAAKWSVNLGMPVNNWEVGIYEESELGYVYSYDPMKRLTAARAFNNVYGYYLTNSYHEDSIGYDLNGNIRHLRRVGDDGKILDRLTYQYNNGNQLLRVNDTGNKTEGFKDGNITDDDYSYDWSGNMIMDKNKSINRFGISYNMLGLPGEVTKSNNENIRFSYDASGKKMSQVSRDVKERERNVEYLDEFIYQNDTLQFILHEEGRVNMCGTLPVYEYVLRDLLGNTRVTFTTRHTSETFTANLENYRKNLEESIFNNYSSIANNLFDHTDAGTIYDRAQILNGGYNGQVGLAKSFSVVPGDTIRATVYAKYAPAPGNNTNLSGFAAALTSAFGLTPGMPGEAARAYQALNQFGSWIISNNRPEELNTGKKGYLNILVFNKAYQLVDIAFSKVHQNAVVTSTQDWPLNASVIVREPGYVFVYLSNEEPKELQIGFDDLTVTHAHSDVMQEDSYYPFGLTFKSTMQENVLKNNYLYNAGSELQDDLDLGVYETFYRMLDPTLGRWWQIDPKSESGQESLTPYHYSFNNPVSYNDPKGDCPPGSPCFGLLYLAIADAAVHPSGIGAHTLGVVQGLQNSATGLVNAVTHPVQTLQGLGNMALAGLAGNPASALQMDAALGTDSYGTMIGVTNAVITGANNLVYGNGMQRGQVLGEIGGGILGSKGLSAGIKLGGQALRSGIQLGGNAVKGGTTTVYRNFGWNEYKALRTSGNNFQIGTNFGSKQFWLDEAGINWWNSTSFSKNFTAKITVNNSALNHGYRFLDAGKYRAISFDSPGALNIFNRNMKIEWIQYK